MGNSTAAIATPAHDREVMTVPKTAERSHADARSKTIENTASPIDYSRSGSMPPLGPRVAFDAESGSARVRGNSSVGAQDNQLGTADPLDVRALSWPRARRLPAPKVDRDEYESLVQEHKELVRTKYSSGLTKKQELRLALVGWHLDTIEAHHDAPNVEMLARVVQTHAALADRVADVVDEIRRLSKASRVTRHGRR